MKLENKLYRQLQQGLRKENKTREIQQPLHNLIKPRNL